MQAIVATAWVSRRADAVLTRLGRAGRRRGVQTAVFVLLVVWVIAPGRWNRAELILPGALAFAMLGSVPLLTLRRLPATSLTLILASNSVFILFGRLAWPMANVVCWLIALVAAPILLHRRGSVVALVATQVVVLSAALLVPTGVNATPWDATVAESLAALLAWTLGVNLVQRHRAALQQAAADERMRVLRQADAESRGRVGIARELHDVVAHHVSLIAVRAATARYSMPELTPPAERAFDEIAEQARTALTELRTVLGVLRSEEVVPEQAPQPTLADVENMVKGVRAAGGRVELVVSGARQVPESVQLCGYRIVQEALTNAGRYAPDGAVRVELDYRPDALEVRVRDDGGSGSAVAQPGSGYGLIGMRERVTMLGGTLRAGPTADGFAVDAVLPLAVPS